MTTITFNQLCNLAFAYLEKNPERFNDQEKVKFMQDIQTWAFGKSDVIADEVYDFLIAVKFIEEQKREQQFASYINDKYGFLRFRKILDVGAGRMCRLSGLLAANGAKVYAMDPNIRLTNNEAMQMGIRGISRDKFYCDEYSKAGRRGTNVRPFDVLVGLEPCDATEHIIRQGLKYDKPFDVLLCAAPHDALDGTKFERYEDWYEHLLKISADVDIKNVNGSYIASNDFQRDNQLGM